MDFKRMKAKSPDNGLFGIFISEGIQEATGFPNGVETPQQKQEFIVLSSRYMHTTSRRKWKEKSWTSVYFQITSK